MTETYFTRKQAAAFLVRIGCPVTYQQLNRWSVGDNSKRGPPFIRVRQRQISYSETDLRAWAKQNVKRIE